MDDDRLHDWWALGGLDAPPELSVEVTGSDPVIDCRHRVGEAAAAALGLGGAWAGEVWRRRGGSSQDVAIDVTAAAASLVGFAVQQAPAADLGRRPPPFTRLYPTADDRWIHLHGGFPHLAAGLVELLGCDDADDAVAAAVLSCRAGELEDAIAAAGLCGAVARSPEEWQAHRQGDAVVSLGAVTVRRISDASPRERPRSDRPLAGIRVADLTRVLAGPTCGRTLASYGADVLRVSSPDLPSVEPYVVETGHGKRNAFADIDDTEQLGWLRELVAGADVFCQSYRTGSVAAREFGAADVAELSPGIVHVSINCYGHVGPWADRAGWEQLAQTASGIAVAEGNDAEPRLIPAAATDYTTGYLAAAGALIALARQIDEGGSWAVEASLCQTSQWLQRGGLLEPGLDAAGLGAIGEIVVTSDTAWGPLTHLPTAVTMSATPTRWELPPSPLGSHPLEWAAAS